ncbi:META domain-containing protein [Gracilimonas sp. Q87]|uniref:META domain-containing protein n=1 Tax=Gracilimonas sp. Q87 TaxID=3384766 RepID=UPI00398431B0
MKNIISIPALLLMFFTGIILSSCDLFNSDASQSQEEPPVENVLAETKWMLAEMQPDGREPVRFELNEESHGKDFFAIYFKQDSTFESHPGCGWIGGNYEVLAENHINIHRVGGTRGVCDYTLEFQRMLRNAQRFESTGDTLVLFHDEIPFVEDTLAGKFVFNKEGFEYYNPWPKD